MAQELDGAYNGYSLTEGVFDRTVMVNINALVNPLNDDMYLFNFHSRETKKKNV